MTPNSHIVVGVDHSPMGAAALRWAVEQASGLGCPVVAVRAFDKAARADLALERDEAQARRHARYRTQQWVVDVISGSSFDVPVRISTPVGAAEDTLVAEAEGAQLVVVGTAQHPRRARLIEGLQSRCACPVVAVDSDGTPHRQSAGSAQPA